MRLSKIFDAPALYSFFQNLVPTKEGTEIARRAIIGDFKEGDVLDFGCGNGQLSELFPESNYLGIEPLSKCVTRAQELFGDKSGKRRFEIGDETSLTALNSNSFDLVLMIGVLHHISDHQSQFALREIHRVLRTSGRLFLIDPVYHPAQSWLSQRIVSLDRGIHVREHENYMALIRNYFPKAQFELHSNLLRIPYDHIYCSATKQ
jgi:SAM-dependent methyltransferase